MLFVSNSIVTFLTIHENEKQTENKNRRKDVAVHKAQSNWKTITKFYKNLLNDLEVECFAEIWFTHHGLGHCSVHLVPSQGALFSWFSSETKNFNIECSFIQFQSAAWIAIFIFIYLELWDV